MNISIRQEEERDYFLVEQITRNAFWNSMRKGCDEHLIVHKLRKVDCYISELGLVLELDNIVIGNIMFSRAKVIGDKEHNVITFGPVSILKKYQRKGYGTKLISYGLQKAKELGFKAVLIYGHPDYYPRFGFVNAKKYNVTTRDGQNFEAFMALELQQGALDQISGRFYESEVFHLNKDDVIEFDKKFTL